MNIDLYSDRAKQAVQSAQSLALARGHQQFAPEHILKVLLEEKDGLSRALIQSAGGRPDQLDGGVETLLAKTPRVDGAGGQLYMKPDTARVFADGRERRQEGRRRLRHHRAPAARHRDREGRRRGQAAQAKAGVSPQALKTADQRHPQGPHR
jgi:ATP-dependent Clp protease ATP-binding subunit ClpB